VHVMFNICLDYVHLLYPTHIHPYYYVQEMTDMSKLCPLKPKQRNGFFFWKSENISLLFLCIKIYDIFKDKKLI